MWTGEDRRVEGRKEKDSVRTVRARFASVTNTKTKPIRISLPDGAEVSGLFQLPPKAKACYVFAHGAGAGMNHAFMAATAEGLSERGIATLRYQFPYMEKGSALPVA